MVILYYSIKLNNTTRLFDDDLFKKTDKMVDTKRMLSNRINPIILIF